MQNIPLQQPFALAPALVGGDQPIDYSTRAGQTLYSAATAELPYKFEGSNSSIPSFLRAIQDRTIAQGWEDIFFITIGQDALGQDILRNLLTHYGEITLAQVRQNAQTDYINMPVRNAQISHQIHQCLIKSISKEVQERLVTESPNYEVNGIADGPSYLMTLIQIYFIKTNATPSTIRLKISDAHLTIAEKSFNIDEFNTEINGHVQRLSANGHSTEDLFAHLIKAYKLVPDKEFARYIRGVIDRHNDGTEVINSEQLTGRAKAKYDELVEARTWMTDDATDRQLVAMAAQLEQIKNSNEILKKKFQPKPQKPKDNKSGSNKPDSNKKKDNSKWAWKAVPPKTGESLSKKVNGKTYHWCTHHKKWCIHKSSECRLATSDRSTNDIAGLQAVLAIDENLFSE